MNIEEISAGLNEAASLPQGRIKSERLELLAAAAKPLGEPALEGRVLLTLSRAYEYGGENDRMLLVFARLLKLLDEFPAELGSMSHAIHWQLKWMTFAMVHNAEVPLTTANRWLDEMESRYRQRGFSPRPVHGLRSVLALSFGDGEAASAAMEASIAATRDSMADCDACERNDWGSWRAELGDDAGAIEFWEPVISGQRRCAEEPHRVLGYALLPLVRLGRTDEARSAYLKGYPMVRRNPSLRKTVGHHIEFCALTGNEARGLEILAEHAQWLTDQEEDVQHRFQFLRGVAVLLRRLTVLGHGGLAVGEDSVAGVLGAVEKELTAIAARYDRRNGNTFVSTRLAARLGQEPLVDWLPLGVSAVLPAAVSAATDRAADRAAEGGTAAAAGAAQPSATSAGSEPWDAVRPTAARAVQSLRDGDPAAAELLAREALRRGGMLIPQADAAQLYTVLVEALQGRPGREADLIDAALKASARWDGISEPDMLHLRFTAALVYHGQDRHAEAVALFEDAIGRVDVPYDRLGVARTRRAYGESLTALWRHREAAEHLLQAAALLQDDEANRRPYAHTAWLAAESLQRAGRFKESQAAYERAASLWEALAEPIAALRCRRSIAWLVFRPDPDQAVALMRKALNDIEALASAASASEELTAEVPETKKQLERMTKQAERRAEYEKDDDDE